uniref:Uncharacterized protein n=1 Tax=Alexandrium monilatum TaxID=311494 RepID=A0A7S4Q1U7_9DINO
MFAAGLEVESRPLFTPLLGTAPLQRRTPPEEPLMGHRSRSPRLAGRGAAAGRAGAGRVAPDAAVRAEAEVGRTRAVPSSSPRCRCSSPQGRGDVGSSWCAGSGRCRSTGCVAGRAPGRSRPPVRPGVPFPWSWTATLRSSSASGVTSGCSAKRRRRSTLHVQPLDRKPKLLLDLPDKLPFHADPHIPFAWMWPLEFDSPPRVSKAPRTRSQPPREAASHGQQVLPGMERGNGKRPMEEHPGCAVQEAWLPRADRPVATLPRPVGLPGEDIGKSEHPSMRSKVGQCGTSKAEVAMEAIRRAEKTAAALASEVQRQLAAMEGTSPRSRSPPLPPSRRTAGVWDLPPRRSLRTEEVGGLAARARDRAGLFLAPPPARRGERSRSRSREAGIS